MFPRVPRFYRTAVLGVSLLCIAACGGGGGTGMPPSSPAGTPTVAPTVTPAAPSPDPMDLDHTAAGRTASPIVFPRPPAPNPSATGGTAPYDTIVLTDKPAAYFRLGDNSATAIDASGNGLAAQYAAQAPDLTRSGSLLVNNAHASTTGSGSSAAYLASGRFGLLESANAVSIEVWYAPSNLSAYQSIAEYGDNESTVFTGYGLKYDAAHQTFAFKIAVAGGGHAFTLVEPASGFHPATGVAYHVAGTYDGSTARLYVNGKLAASQAVTGSIAYDAPAHDSGLVLFNDALRLAPASGSLQEAAIYTSALLPAAIRAHYEAGATAYTDWSTFGDDLSRSGNNPGESTISRTNAAGLNVLWKYNSGAAIDAQPLVATGIPVSGGVLNLVLIGAENGSFAALNAETGAVVWQKPLGSTTNVCTDVEGGQYGITGTAVFDRAHNLVYVADGQNEIHALNASNGVEAPGYPVLLGNVSSEHVYSALTYNPANGTLYAATASYCDNVPYHGRLVAINASTGGIVTTFEPVTSSYGGGMWGMGGESIDAIGDVYVATGNPSSQYGESLLQLSSALAVSAAGSPSIKTGDYDFGATPLLVQTPGCPSQAIVKNKDGELMTWDTASIGGNPVQRLQMAYGTQAGSFIGLPAYSPATNLLYVGDPSGSGGFGVGLIALSEQATCTWTLAWQQPIGTNNTDNNNDPPSVANGVVYYNDGVGDEASALDAASGTPLWNSGATIGGPVFAAPVIDGHLFVGSWDHQLYAFAL